LKKSSKRQTEKKSVTRNGGKFSTGHAFGQDTKRSGKSSHKSQFDGEFNMVYGNPLNGRKDNQFLKEQSNFNFTWRLINKNGVD
jgi:hypothetical protein